MDQLYDTVKQSLDGLVIPPLQNIINEFLPDRAILSSRSLFSGIDKKNPTMCVRRYYEFVILDCFNGDFPATFSVQSFNEFVLDFSKFLPHRSFCDYRYTAVVIYQGETEVIEIH